MSARAPGPASVPLLGARAHLPAFVLDPARWLTRLHARYGELACLHDRRQPIVFGFGLDHNRRIHTDIDTFEVDGIDSLPALRDCPGAQALMSGLSMMNGPRHRTHRRLLQPLLQRSVLGRYVADIVDCTAQLLERWRSEGRRELHAEMFELARAIGVRALLGLDPETEGRCVGEQVDATIDGLFAPLAVALPVDLPGTPFARALRNATGLEARLREMIERRKRAPAKADLLSTLIHANTDESMLSADELIGHTLTLFRGAYPSTALALSWTLLMLATHPRALACVHAEIDEVCGTRPPASLDASQLSRLVYCEAALLEGMRLFPPALWLTRVAAHPFELDGHGFPAKTRVFSCPLTTHRRPELYPSAARFEPERFLAARPGTYSYLAFSTGPRRCLGAEFAMMSMKVALAMISSSYHVQVPEGTKIHCRGLRGPLPAGGLWVEILRRRPASPPPPAPRALAGNLDRWVDRQELG